MDFLESRPDAGYMPALTTAAYVFYHAQSVSAAHSSLALDSRAGDSLLAIINGAPASPAATQGAMTVFDLPDAPADILLLYENPGHANFGDEIEVLSGIREAHILPHGRRIRTATPIKGWVMHEVEQGGSGPEIAPDFNDDDWSNVAVNKLDASNVPSYHTAVFRARVNLSAEQLSQRKVRFSVGRIDDTGTIYINGRKIGQADSWSQPYSFDATDASCTPAPTPLRSSSATTKARAAWALPPWPSNPPRTPGPSRWNFAPRPPV